ncbi:MAG TPA: hypothetical protein VJM46_04675 [Candidatus Saccharimonadales bacterium]|nr:hypothetical protein [Candidatus Saccharimonadales bacterium]
MVDFKSIEIRLRWVIKRRNLLDRSMRRYKKLNPLRWRAVVAEDRMSYSLITTAIKQPPFDEWALWHAGIVHDLRSILDNAVWVMAHASGAPTKPTKLEFPIVTDPTKWKEASKKIVDLNETARKAIEKLQPFNLPLNDPVGSTLRILNQLDIQNKHHAPIITAVSDKQQFKNERKIIYKVQPESHEETRIKLFPIEFREGSVVLQELTPKPIEKVEQGNFTGSSHFVIRNENGAEYPIIGSIDHLIKGVQLTLNALGYSSSGDPEN